MARKTKQQAAETRAHILDVAIRLFSQRGVSATSLADIAQAAGVTRGAIYWHFRNKADLFNEIWQSSKENVSALEAELKTKYPDDPLAVLREILICVLEMGVCNERRRLILDIIYHKCEYAGEMESVYQAHRDLCLEDYECIEQTLEHCVQAGLLPGTLQLRRAAVVMRAWITGLIENWLLAPQSVDLAHESRVYIEILLEMYQHCPALHSPSLHNPALHGPLLSR